MIEELDLTHLANEEAIEILRLANEGRYEKDDMPERWHGVFERMEQEV